jgi:CD63 antigen
MENCCESLVKYFMVFFNILFILAGCILIGFGAWSQVDAKDFLNFLGDNYVNTPIFLMIVGGVIFVVAFMGCCGAWKESKCLIYTYAFFLAVILVAQIGAGIAAYMLKGELDTEVVKNMNAGMTNYNKSAEFDGVTHTWDIVQNELHCCGVENYTDWTRERSDIFPKGQVPDSCCVGGQVEGCGAKPNSEVEKFEQGCYSLFKAKFIDNIAIVGGVALGVAAIELAIVLFACCLGKRMGYTSQYV